MTHRTHLNIPISSVKFSVGVLKNANMTKVCKLLIINSVINSSTKFGNKSSRYCNTGTTKYL